VAETAHCWHDTGEHPLSHPRRRRQLCCWCGGTREVHFAFADRGGHGPQCPPLVEAVEVHGPPGPCPGRPQPEVDAA
jgi:hypothetical protein